MRGSHVAAAIALLLAAQCLPILEAAEAAGPVTAWHMQGTQLIPIMSFDNAEACARAARELTAKSGTYFGCVAGAPSDTATQDQQKHPASLDHSFNDVIEMQKLEPAARREQHQGHRTTHCSITGSDAGLTAICKAY